MPTFLADPPQGLYLFLAAALIITGLVWLNRRNRKSLTAFLVVLGLTAVFLLVDRLFESPREEAVRRTQAMVQAADKVDPDSFVAQVADTVVYKAGSEEFSFTRDQLRRHSFWHSLRQFHPHVAAWDFSRDDVKRADANSVEIGFLTKAEAEGKPIPMYFRATFARQADGQFKLTRIASFDPMQRDKPFAIPQLRP